MKYFFDNNISFRYAAMLRALGVDATALRDEFAASIKDDALFVELSGSDRVYVTNDIAQASRRVEAAALKEAGVTALFLGRFWGKKTFWAQAAWLVAKWPKIDGFASSVVQGTCAEIKENGRIAPFTL